MSREYEFCFIIFCQCFFNIFAKVFFYEIFVFAVDEIGIKFYRFDKDLFTKQEV